MQPSVGTKGHLQKSFYIHHLISFSQEPCKRNAVSTHFIDTETEAEGFKWRMWPRRRCPLLLSSGPNCHNVCPR